MSDKATRKDIYKDCRKELGLSQAQLGRIMHLGEDKGQSDVFKKEQPIESKTTRGVSLSEALALQLLKIVADDGYDVFNIEFDETGRITKMPTKSK